MTSVRDSREEETIELIARILGTLRDPPPIEGPVHRETVLIAGSGGHDSLTSFEFAELVFALEEAFDIELLESMELSQDLTVGDLATLCLRRREPD